MLVMRKIHKENEILEKWCLPYTMLHIYRFFCWSQWVNLGPKGNFNLLLIGDNASNDG